MSSRKRWLFIAVIVAPVLVSGCSGRPSPVGVTGEVTLDGAPIPEGTIVFEPAAATEGQRRDTAIKLGAFDLPEAEGVLPGIEFKVIIKAFKKTGQKYPKADMSASYDEFVQYIPDKYNSQSTLQAVLSTDARENHLKFELVSEP